MTAKTVNSGETRSPWVGWVMANEISKTMVRECSAVCAANSCVGTQPPKVVKEPLALLILALKLPETVINFAHLDHLRPFGDFRFRVTPIFSATGLSRLWNQHFIDSMSIATPARDFSGGKLSMCCWAVFLATASKLIPSQCF